MPSITCHFWNAGQGLFSSGKIALPDNKEFVWVYDCGSTSKRNINTAVSNMKQTYPNEIIDLLAISHFDRDHTNGLSTLLADRKVKQWLLPYYPLWQRLIIALSLNFQPDSNEFDFFLNPVKFILDNYSESFTENSQIILVPAQQNLEDISHSKVKDNQSFSFQNNVKFENELDEFFQPSVRLIKPYIPMAIEDIEFLPYNIPFNLLKDELKNVNLSEEQIKDILQDDTLTTQNKIDAIKNYYYQALNIQNNNDDKKNSEPRNKLSLYLYIGKIKNTFNEITYKHKNITNTLYTNSICDSFLLIKDILHQTNNYSNIKKHIVQILTFKQNKLLTLLRLKKYNDVFNTYYLSPIIKDSILYCGDGYLKDEKQLEHITQSFKQERMQRIACLQVPHHGSRNNWTVGLSSNYIQPYISVFCAAPKAGYNHPHPEIVFDFIHQNPILVDNSNLLTIHFQ